jgi:hypothetical protein
MLNTTEDKDRKTIVVIAQDRLRKMRLHPGIIALEVVAPSSEICHSTFNEDSEMSGKHWTITSVESGIHKFIVTSLLYKDMCVTIPLNGKRKLYNVSILLDRVGD